MIFKRDRYIFEKLMRCAKVSGLFFLGCAFRMLIGWASNTPITWTKARKLYISYDKKLVERPVPNREALVAFKGAVSATPLFLFTSGDNKLNCSK